MKRVLIGLLIVMILCVAIYFAYHEQADESTHILTSPIQVEDDNVQAKAYDESKYRVSDEPGKKFGPFYFDQKRLFVTYDYSDSIRGYLFEIKDEAGVSYYNQLHPSSDDSFYDVTGAFKLEGKSGFGLIIFYDLEPNAPPCGPEFQVFGMKNGILTKLSESIIVCGNVEDLPEGDKTGTLRLLDGDIIKAEVWKDMFGIIVPFKIDFQNMTIAPAVEDGVFGINLPDDQLESIDTWSTYTFTVFSDHNRNSKVEELVADENHKIEIPDVYAKIKLEKAGSHQLEIVITDVWVHVKVDDNEGWISHINELHNLGLKFYN